MKSALRSVRPLLLPPALLALAATLSACAGDVNPIRDAAQGVGLATAPREPAAFVRDSRPARYEFMPIGTDAPPRAQPRKTPEQFRAMEAQLDAERAALEARAVQLRAEGATPPPQRPVVPPVTPAPPAE